MSRGEYVDAGEPELTEADLTEIHRGNRLAPGEAVVWQGRPAMRGVIRDVFHARAVFGYFAVLFAFDAYQAWAKGLPASKAAHDSVPLLMASLLVLAVVGALAVAVARTTDYTFTDRRVILRYGVAMPAVLSLPFSKITTCAAALRPDHTGDIALVLKAGNRMPFLKLWPLARPWHLSAPQPMLRAVPQAAVVAALLVRALRTAEQMRQVERDTADAVQPERLSA